MPVRLVETAGGVRILTLNRPAARNALSSELIDRLVGALHAAEDDPKVRAVVLTGADPAFCAGLDLREAGAEGLPSASAPDRKGAPGGVLGGMSPSITR